MPNFFRNTSFADFLVILFLIMGLPCCEKHNSEERPIPKQSYNATDLSTQNKGGNEGSGISGGDSLNELFFVGRSEAEQTLIHLQTLEILPEFVPPRIHDWFFRYQKELLEDFRESPLLWVNYHGNSLDTCAATEKKRKATIQLSLHDCRHVNSTAQVVQLLFHELSHHFGADEELATELGILLQQIKEHIWPKETRIMSCQTAEIYHPDVHLCFEFIDFKEKGGIARDCENGFAQFMPGLLFAAPCPTTRQLAGCHFSRQENNTLDFSGAFSSYFLWFYQPTILRDLDERLCGDQTYIQICEGQRTLVQDFSVSECSSSD